jgi:hypothetical protein
MQKISELWSRQTNSSRLFLLYREPSVPTVHLFGNVEHESLYEFHIFSPIRGCADKLSLADSVWASFERFYPETFKIDEDAYGISQVDSDSWVEVLRATPERRWQTWRRILAHYCNGSIVFHILIPQGLRWKLFISRVHFTFSSVYPNDFVNNSSILSSKFIWTDGVNVCLSTK